MRRPSLYLSSALILLFPLFLSAQSEWLTWGYDQERTGWNKAETTLNRDNVSQLELKWTAQLDTKPDGVVLSTMTTPLVVNTNTPQGQKTLVFVVGSDASVYAIDAETGKLAWKRAFPNTEVPKIAATWLCSNTQNATPVIDKQAGIIYFNTIEGKLRGLSIANGEDRLPPTEFIPPFARNWSLNLIDNIIYTPMGRGCGGMAAHFTALDLKDPNHRYVEFYASPARPGGAWGRGGMVRGPKGIYTQTADAPYDPAAGKFGETVMVFNPKDLRLVDSFTPSDWEYMNVKDLDLGAAGPVVFPFKQWTLVASASKQAVLYLLDANNLGGADHHTALYQSAPWGNDEVLLYGRGIWGGMASWEDPQGRRWVLMPMWGPPAKAAPAFKTTYGDAPDGSVMAFEIVVDNGKPTAVPTWRSRNMHVPDIPAVSNGVVYAIQTGENTSQGRGITAKDRSTPVTNEILYAFDAENGKELFSSKNTISSWEHFSEPVVAAGKVFVETWDGKVYAFGLKK